MLFLVSFSWVIFAFWKPKNRNVQERGTEGRNAGLCSLLVNQKKRAGVVDISQDSLYISTSFSAHSVIYFFFKILFIGDMQGYQKQLPDIIANLSSIEEMVGNNGPVHESIIRNLTRWDFRDLQLAGIWIAVNQEFHRKHQKPTRCNGKDPENRGQPVSPQHRDRWRDLRVFRVLYLGIGPGLSPGDIPRGFKLGLVSNAK